MGAAEDGAARRLLEAWKRFAKRLAEIQLRLLLTLFYYLIIPPFALMIRRADPLAIRLKSSPRWQAWATRTEGSEVERARSRS